MEVISQPVEGVRPRTEGDSDLSLDPRVKLFEILERRPVRVGSSVTEGVLIRAHGESLSESLLVFSL